ncbi:metallophosphoesterase [Pedobacter duraquae]|uniref:acid phosphatase n=1 Tax=Pedobacter duraquae TaxID=425511 RepID=A0A4R6IEM0_9SPHI|nr:metallophosphoesterase [Pedobacter duraquae]TDO20196.1 calcineurin-like phosphoesterase family protein [Pedobacter duraquae]
MRRRDFVKGTAIAALGAVLVDPLDTFAETGETQLSSDDVSMSSALPDDYSLHFMAVGDWGRNGEYDQTKVAQQMGLWAAQRPNNFIISTGDNIYPKGVVSEMDPQWHYCFESIYTAHSLQCDWFPVLGNHDHLSDPDAQLRYSKISRRWNMPAKYYTKEVDLKNGNGKVLFVMIDTDPMLFDEKKDYTTKQLTWINDTLKNASSDIKWKIVVGHHPYYTVGPRIKNYDTLKIREIMTKVFQEHKVDVYLSGHDHSLQHIKPEGVTHQFISGAGSELTPVTSGVANTRFQASEHGFMYFSIDKNRLNVKAVNMDGKMLYETELTK